MTRDETRTPTGHQLQDPSHRPDPDDYVPPGDEERRDTGAEDPDEVALGSRRPGAVDDPAAVPSGESEQDLVAEDLGLDEDAVDDDEDAMYEMEEGPPG